MAATLSPRGREPRSAAAARRPAPAGSSREPRPTRTLALGFPPFLATFTLAAGWAGTLSSLFPLYGARALELPADAIGQAVSLSLLADLLCLTLTGWAADRLDRRAVLLPALGRGREAGSAGRRYPLDPSRMQAGGELDCGQVA